MWRRSAMRWLAFGYREAGRLRLAEQECLEALTLVEQIGQHSAMTGYFHCLLTEVNYHWNRLAEAASCVQQILRIAHLAAGRSAARREYLWSAASLASGDVAAAEPVLPQMEELVRQERLTNIAGKVVATRVQYWLAARCGRGKRLGAQAVFSPER